MDKQKDFEKGWEEYKAKKKKAVEEIGQDIADICSDMALNCCGSTPCYACIAKRLERKGYRKIPENAVVLGQEEYKKLKHGSGTLEQLYNQYPYRVLVGFNSMVFSQDRESYEKLYDEIEEKASKETAEKFAEHVKMAFYYEFDELIPSIMSDKIDEIAKEFTEGKV